MILTSLTPLYDPCLSLMCQYDPCLTPLYDPCLTLMCQYDPCMISYYQRIQIILSTNSDHTINEFRSYYQRILERGGETKFVVSKSPLYDPCLTLMCQYDPCLTPLYDPCLTLMCQYDPCMTPLCVNMILV